MVDYKIKEQELIGFFKDTSELASVVHTNSLSMIADTASALPAAQMAGNLANKVEFWKWMGRNFNCLGSPDLIAKRAEGGGAAADWLHKQVQGKGYEWDYFNKLRNDPRNILSRIELSDIPNQPGHDMLKVDINGKITKYQNKAYTSNNPLDLSNTPQDTVVVANKEKITEAVEKGYKTEGYKTKDDIIKDTDKRMSEAAGGKAGQYTISNVSGVMLKAGAVAFTVNAGIEAIKQYKRYKNGEINGIEYLQSIASAGIQRGVTSAATAAIMIPIQAAITVSGLAAPIAIPIGFIIESSINKLVAPLFGRGDYAVQLVNAKYYNNLNKFYSDLEQAYENAGESYRIFVINSIQQKQVFDNLLQQDMGLTYDLNALSSRI